MVLKFAEVTGILLLLMAVTCIPLGLLSKREFSRRSAQLAAHARSLGLEHSRDKTRKAILDKRFFLERLCAWPSQDVILGRWRGLQVSYADYRYVTGPPTYQRIDYAVACATLNIKVPYLRVRRKGGGLRSPDKRVGNRAAESSSGRFSRDFQVKSQDREFAGKLIDADMMAWLRSSDAQLTFEIGGNQLAVWTLSSSESLEFPRLFDAAIEFAAHIPKALLDEYSSPARPL